MRIKKSIGDRIGDILIYAFLILLTLSIIAPFWDILCESLSNGWATGFHRFWPSNGPVTGRPLSAPWWERA